MSRRTENLKREAQGTGNKIVNSADDEIIRLYKMGIYSLKGIAKITGQPWKRVQEITFDYKNRAYQPDSRRFKQG